MWIVFWAFVFEDVYFSIYGVHHEGENGWFGYPGLESLLFCAWLFTSVVFARWAHNKKMEPGQSEVSSKLYFVILGGMFATICSNIAHLNHTPGNLLFDVGFYFIGELSETSFWRKVNDMMTVNLPIGMAVGLYLCPIEERRRMLCKWGELSFYGYLIRGMMVPLTSLPGPAPHCKIENYNPPHLGPDLLYRLGPIYGNFNTCGDLIPSGHAYWCTTTLMLILSLCNHKFGHAARNIRFTLGCVYLLIMAVFTIASRKHYTIDIFVGTGLSYLMFHRCVDYDNWLSVPAQDVKPTKVDWIIAMASGTTPMKAKVHARNPKQSFDIRDETFMNQVPI
jgi:hypothetical protein